MSGYLKLKVVEGRKLNSPSNISLQPNQLRPIVQIKLKYEDESTEPAQVNDESKAKWGEIFDFHVNHDEKYFYINVYNEEIKKENLLGVTRIGTVTFKDQVKVDRWFPFYFVQKKKYNLMGEIHVIGKFIDENEYDEDETDPDFLSDDLQNNNENNHEENSVEINNENEYSYIYNNNGSECSFASNNNESVYSRTSNNNESVYSRTSNNNGSVYSNTNNNNESIYSNANNNNGSVRTSNNNGSVYSNTNNNNGSVYSRTSNNNGSVYSNANNNNGSVYSHTSNNNGSVYSNTNYNPNNNNYRSETSNTNNSDVPPRNSNDVVDDEEEQLALALKMSLEEESMRQEAARSGLISNNEDYILAKVLALSMDDALKSNVYFPKSNISGNVVGSPENNTTIAFENDIDEPCSMLSSPVNSPEISNNTDDYIFRLFITFFNYSFC